MEELLDGFVPGLPSDLRARILARALNCVGPDGQTVALEDCRPGRRCHEAY